ncbi:glycine betaine ABC transporter substrate-binding protein [Desulfovibrio sp. X2]|uniref:glycine betaine ABC transporter substrate-binding protein n=1 Tax=Desulfovibrio sp. X2 TaxID=941449 RepID=UPI00054F26EF|nr:glycine betaine ABC transporter substrate-binding protein [Desulfovibrio sp. X2]
MTKILTAVLAAALSLGLALPAVAAKKKVRIAYVEWSSATASTNMVKAVLQEKMGYDVETLPVSAAAMWQAVGTGDVDAMVAAWLPATHADYYAKVKDKVEDLGPIVSGARLGWAVPDYVTIDSMDQVNANADKFDGKVIGIDPGAGLMRLSEKAIKEYGMDKMELMEGSGATMTASLGDAIKHHKWIVVTAWSPHWMFGRWHLKYLKDPKGVLGKAEHIDTIVRKGLSKDMPEVYAFLKRFHWPSLADFQTVMAWNQEPGADPYANAKKYMDEHPDVVKEWLGRK